MLKIDEVMHKLCEVAAQSVRRYNQVVGMGPWAMPEYFMPAFILDHLGDEITMTLETGFDSLVKWNDEIRKRRGSPQPARDDRLLRLAEQLGGRRVDLVIFEGEEEHKPKDQQDVFAIVEFKRGWIDANRDPGRVSDRDKLLMLLTHLDMCPWGIVCGWASEDHVRWQKDLSIKPTSDRWYEKKIELPKEFTTPIVFFARVFGQASDNGRIEESLSALPPSSAPST